MRYLDITAVVPGPRVAIGAVTFHSGYVALVRNPGFRGVLTADSREDVAFFVPDAPPVTTAPSALGLELSVRRFQSLADPGLVAVGPTADRAEVVPDPRGGEHRWLQVAFRVPVYSHALVEINYRVTVVD